MKIFLFLFQLLTSTLALFNSNSLAQLLLLNQYGSSNHQRTCRFVRYPRDGGLPGRRCRRNQNNNDIFRLALFSALTPTPTPIIITPSPSPTPTGNGSFPDSMTLERQTLNGSETVSVGSLDLGDYVRCLQATKGPRTARPELGWCKVVNWIHNENVDKMFEQLFFVGDDGKEHTIAATSAHLIWKSMDNTRKGTADPRKISIANSMFVPISTIQPGDVIMFEHNNKWEYRTVTAHRKASMFGVRNPSLTDGGLPIVNGVLATTTATGYRGGHWGTYFQYIWMQDWKFCNITAPFNNYFGHTLSQAQRKGLVKVEPECLISKIVKDMDHGVDVTDFNSYDAFVKAYVLSCIEKQIPSMSDLANLLANSTQLG